MQAFIADTFNQSNYEPYHGVIGLGLGSPKFGSTFLANLKEASKG